MPCHKISEIFKHFVRWWMQNMSQLLKFPSYGKVKMKEALPVWILSRQFNGFLFERKVHFYKSSFYFANGECETIILLIDFILKVIRLRFLPLKWFDGYWTKVFPPVWSVTRRHHCRSCGDVIICASCSRFKRVLPEFNLLESVKVCIFCHTDNTVYRESKMLGAWGELIWTVGNTSKNYLVGNGSGGRGIGSGTTLSSPHKVTVRLEFLHHLWTLDLQVHYSEFHRWFLFYTRKRTLKTEVAYFTIMKMKQRTMR